MLPIVRAELIYKRVLVKMALSFIFFFDLKENLLDEKLTNILLASFNYTHLQAVNCYVKGIKILDTFFLS